MPSTFTENTGIELIADGEQSGLWGQTTNDNFDIIDRALNGSVNISLSGTTHTLTTASGVLSDGQFAVLVFTGSPSGTNTVTVEPNTAQKTYFVTNSTAQTVVLSQGSGANVSVPAGLSKIVFTNGAGAGAAVSDITNTLSGTFTGNVTGDLTGNANITGGTIDGTVIGGSTPAAISGTTGSFSGNVGIGTSTITEALTVEGNIRSSSSIRASGLVAAGDATAPHFSFSSDTGMGMFRANINNLGFSTAGVERIRINGVGQVGIGTTNPVQSLDVVGGVNVSGRLRSTGGGSAAVPSIQPGNDNDTGIFHPATNTIGFSTTGSERMRIDPSGNVGIGKENPTEALEVVGNAHVSGAIRPSGLTTDGDAASPHFSFSVNQNLGMFRVGANTLGFATNGAERLRITPAGTLQSPGGSAFTGTVATGSTLGAIMQRGSNSNGAFVRFADGTQICTHLLTVGTVGIASASGVFRSSPAAWTFPAAFSVTPNGQGGNDPSSNQIWGATRPKSSTEADIVLYSGAAVTSTRSARVTAIGRWF